MIRVLDQKTIDKIAAGEVIERPMSVVKELVENSIDAGATSITVEIKDGGTSMIRVTDNGCGIGADEVRTAYLSHATSKLSAIEDLDSMMTLGFRGEALSTISAVTETEMVTKTRDAETGVKYVIHGGREISFEEVGAPDGTTIVARNLFYNTPARLKYLKSNMTEGAYISDLMSHIALAEPNISFRLISGGKTVLETSGNGGLTEAVYQIYGRDIAKSLLPVDGKTGDITVTGFVGKPFLAKGNRSFENYYVNKRYIKSPVITRAIEEAYKTYVMQHRFPFTVLFFTLPMEQCDINVHPAKREFRFSDEKTLFSACYHAVADALSNREMIPDMDRDYGQKAKLYQPLKKDDSNTGVSQDSRQMKTVETMQQISGMHNSETLKDTRLPVENRVSASVQNESDYRYENKTDPILDEVSEYKHTYQSFSGQLSTASENNNKRTNSSSFGNITGVSGKTGLGGDSYSMLEAMLPQSYRDKLRVQETEKEEALETSKEERQNSIQEFRQDTLTDDSYLSKEAIPHHRIIGQVFRTYWITEFDGSLYLMDQHAAHEKVNYETFLAEFRERSVVSQQIFPPRVFHLSAKEKAAVMEYKTYFDQTGFEVEDFGGNDVAIRSVPVNLIGLDGFDIFEEFCAYLSEGITGLTEDIFVHKLATMGCKAAIKGNQTITEAEAQTLIEKLLTLDNPYTCPHGRPTIIRMTKEELDKKFKRIVE